MIVEVYRCIVCRAEFATAKELAEHRCPHHQDNRQNGDA
jgi:DNA-directed RNA polymerase subunit RPC12/RpoP